jgi:hypothetical protein
VSNTPEPQYGGQPPPQQYGGQPPPQQYGGQPPPRKRRKWPIVLGILALLVILGIAGCVALVGGAAKSIDDSLTEAEERAAPREVTEGTAFTVGSHETLAGWKVKKDTSLGDAHFNVTGKVKNTSDKTSTAFIHFKFLTSSGEVLGNVQCNSSDLEPGQTEALNCIPDGKFGKYVKITAEATF